MTVNDLLLALGINPDDDAHALALDNLFNREGVNGDSPIAVWNVESEAWEVS